MLSRAGLRAAGRCLRLPKQPRLASRELRSLSSFRAFPPAVARQSPSLILSLVANRSTLQQTGLSRDSRRLLKFLAHRDGHFTKVRKPPFRQRLNEPRFRRRLYIYLSILLLWAGFSGWLDSIGVPRPQYVALALLRTYRVMQAVLLDIWDYKTHFAWEEVQKTAREAEGRDAESIEETEERRRRRKEVHLVAAGRIFEALKKNSGIYVKLGQHVAAVQLLPPEWTETMKPLQDQCFPTPLGPINEMMKADLGGKSIHELFSFFQAKPIGVASLAQVHRAIEAGTGRHVAVKVQHPSLQEFADIDMHTVNFAVWLVKRVFPAFEFSWLAEEMNEMLPLELDFRCEAANAERARREFEPLRGETSLYIPKVVWAEKRVEVMEYIQGARIDDLQYLKEHDIDRNQVSQELSRIFSRMVYINGFFHADPHHGNLLIRPKATDSDSPFNFDICLLDHGQYFDVPDDLRADYARFWLSLIKRNSPQTTLERRKWAKRVGNIEDDMYPILESAITGRVNMADPTPGGAPDALGRPSSLLDKPNMGENELARLRTAMMEREGLIESIFQLLRTVPRRLLMILKLSDLQRSLDNSLHTTHGQSRVFMIVARYCAEAAYRADLADLRGRWRAEGLSWGVMKGWVGAVWTYVGWRVELGLAEGWTEVRARGVKVGLFFRGLGRGGLGEAEQVMAGLR